MNRGNKILKVENVRKVIGNKEILNIDEYSVIKDKFNFIIGPNGSGKTTLLNILCLVDKDFEGDLYYKGKLVDKEEENLELRRNFSVIWQDPYLYRGDVRDNIELPLKLRGISKKERVQRVREIVEKIEIYDLLDQSPFTLSGGEKQKVSIARALVTDPEVLFVDEATTNLDEESVKFFNSHFADLVTEDMTVVMISHDRRQIKKLADRVTLLRKGEVAVNRDIDNFDFKQFGGGIGAPMEEII